MKLSIGLSVLLLGGAIVMGGCGGGSGSDDSGTAGNSSSVSSNISSSGNSSSVSSENGGSSSSSEAAAPEFTAGMLAGKTFYTYGLENGGQGTENRAVVTFNADASGMNVHNHADAQDTFSVDGNNTIIDGKMHWSVPGMTPTTITAVKQLDDGSFIVSIIDPDHFDPYPQLFSTTELSDKGQAVFTAYLAEQTLSKDEITANPWYNIDWMSADNAVQCQALFTFNADNTIDASYMDDNGQLQSLQNIAAYVVSGNRLEYDGHDSEGQARQISLQPVLKDSAHIIWTDSTAYFKNRADAEAFLNYIDPDNVENCMKAFPPQP